MGSIYVLSSNLSEEDLMILKKDQGMITGVVGIDPSFTALGLARQDLRFSEPVIKWETVRTSTSDGSRLERIVKIWSKCQKFIDRSDIVFMEDYAYSAGRRKNAAQSLAQLGELCGILNLLILKWTDHEVIKVTPGQWKKFLCGNGNLNKDSFKIKIYRKFKIETDTNDASVAVAICDLGAHVCIGREEWRELNLYEHDVLKKIHKLHGESLEPIREAVRVALD